MSSQTHDLTSSKKKSRKRIFTLENKGLTHLRECFKTQTSGQQRKPELILQLKTGHKKQRKGQNNNNEVRLTNQMKGWQAKIVNRVSSIVNQSTATSKCNLIQICRTKGAQFTKKLILSLSIRRQTKTGFSCPKQVHCLNLEMETRIYLKH